MDLMEGTRLSTFLRQPCDDKYEPAVLDPNVDDAVLDTVFEQIAGFLLQISQLSFPRIGATSKPNATSPTTQPTSNDASSPATASHS